MTNHVSHVPAQLGHASTSVACSAQDQVLTPPLIMLQVGLSGFSSSQNALALVDSGASYNFMGKSLCAALGWKLTSAHGMNVRLANGDTVVSCGSVMGTVSCGKWRGCVRFVVVDLAFDVVLGLPWLTSVNPRVDWRNRTLAVLRKGHWLPLPTVAQDRAFMSLFQPCKSPETNCPETAVVGNAAA